jgi:hypothetical protein
LRNAWQTPKTSSSAASGRRLIFAIGFFSRSDWCAPASSPMTLCLHAL